MILMAELKKKEKVLQISVSMETFLKFQEIYYKYATKEKWKSREDMIKSLLNMYETKKQLQPYIS